MIQETVTSSNVTLMVT